MVFISTRKQSNIQFFSNKYQPPAQTNTGTSNSIALTDAQKKIIDNLAKIREAGSVRVEKGSIQNVQGGSKADTTNFPNNGRFVGDKYGSYKKINAELSKNTAYKNLPYYLQQEIGNNMSNYVLRLMSTTEGTKELKDWMKQNGKTANSYSEYNELAIKYVMEQLKPLADDVSKKYEELKKQGKTDKEILDALIGKTSGVTNAGKGLIDLESFRKEINNKGVYLSYPIPVGGQQFGYRTARGGEIHPGVDCVNSNIKGSMIQAPMDGKVSKIAAYDIAGSNYGYVVEIQHHKNLISTSAHLDNNSAKVKVGDTVTKGLTTIAEMGNTGTGYPGDGNNHLHFEMLYSLDGNKGPDGSFNGEVIKISPVEFSADLKKSGLSVDDFMKSQAFKTHLENLQKQLSDTLDTYGKNKITGQIINQRVFKYCDSQIKLIKKAIDRIN